jgi:DnaK suppressor protein
MEEMSKHKANVERERYLLLKGILEDRRREIHEKLRSLREGMPADVPEVTDAEEQSVNDFVQDVDLALMQMKSETLKKIDMALMRLEEGTYGLCQECDRPIAPARLRALPFAALCRSCQEDAETSARAEREAKAFERLQKELVNVTLRAGTRD